MALSMRILLGLTILLAARPAVGDGVDHYELAPSVLRAAGAPPIYPAGVNNPSLGNPSGPPPEGAVPTPLLPGAPNSVAPAGASTWPASNPASPSNAPVVIGTPGAWNPPPSVVQPPTYSVAVPTPAPAAAIGPPSQACWYTRAEYFHWNERSGGTDFVNEAGALYTLGYTRQFGVERFRAELFGGQVNYQGYDMYQATSSSPIEYIPLSNNTDYLGLRGEYELVLAPAAWEGRAAFLVGFGTRFWIRGFPDGTDAQGNMVPSIQETWWTFYPYLGLETHLPWGSNLEVYSESRVGATALTYQLSTVDTNPLWPQPGIMANTEIGLRGSHFFAAARVEVMSWSPSPLVWGSSAQWNQPNSVMFTAGGRCGFMF
jgi:hypothetical protein